MITNKLTKILVIPTTVLLAACGSIPIAVTQPMIEQPAVQNLPVVEEDSTQTETGSTEPEPVSSVQANLIYPIVDTDQVFCYDDRSSISCPSEGTSFYGQDAQYTGEAPRYQDNGDGTVSDLVTGLMWQADPGEKMSYDQAVGGAPSLSLAGYSDWRLPTIKELYSLIQFDGKDVSGPNSTNLIPFIDTNYFEFEYGNESAGERMIDSQWATSSVYTGNVMNGQQAMFGVNFADGRIKGYGTGGLPGRAAKTFFVIYVRGNTSYGVNNYVDNGNGTVTDYATGLTWTQNDSGQGLDWEGALNYCESLDYGGISDWRLPNAKELHSNVDYSRSPDATNSAAIDPIFNISTITNEAGQLDYPAFWTSTTHVSSNGRSGTANYIAFGRGLGYMNGQWMDVHGAGAQRSEEKSGDPSRYPTGHGPQGDAVRIYNHSRCVTDGTNSGVLVGGGVDNTPTVRDQGLNPDNQSQVPQGQVQNGQAPQGGLPNGRQGSQQGQQGPNGGRPQIDFAAAAAELGVSEQALRQALGPPPPDFTAAAAQLGVTEQALIAALGIPAGGPLQGGGQLSPPNQF